MHSAARASRRPARFELAASLIAPLAVLVAWSGLLQLGFSGEDFQLLARQRDGFQFAGHVFRPLWDAWFWLSQRLWGTESAFPYHASVLLLHASNAWLVYWLGRGLRLGSACSALAAILFGMGAGVADGLSWIAAVNRLWSGLGCLLALNGLVRFGRAERRWSALLSGGLALQYLANEEVYGTLLLCLAWLAGLAAREREAAGRRRAWVALGACALLLGVHFLFLRGSAQGPLAQSGGLRAALADFPRNALARVDPLGEGLGLASWAIRSLLAAGLLLQARMDRHAGTRTSLFLLGCLLASCVPFALESGSRFRDYPTQAPLALILAAGVAAIATAVARWTCAAGAAGGASAARVLDASRTTGRDSPWTWLLVAPALLVGRSARAEALAAWREASAEIEACLPEARRLAREQPQIRPVLVNLHTSTRMLWVYEQRLASLESTEGLGFLDAAGGYVAPIELDGLLAGGRTLFGRRWEGGIGVLEPGYFADRPRLEPYRLYVRARPVASLAEALEHLRSPQIDVRREALVEAPPQALAPLGAGVGDPESTALRTLAPLQIDAARFEARASFESECERTSLFVAQDAWLYADVWHFSPDYARLGRLAETRVVRARAQIDGAEPVPLWFANAYGLALLLPPGRHRIDVTFALAQTLDLQR